MFLPIAGVQFVHGNHKLEPSPIPDIQSVPACSQGLVGRRSTSFPGSTPLSRWRPREDPGTHRYDTHVDWSEDTDILTLVVIGQNCLPCEMTYLCSCICHFLCNLKRNYRRSNIPRVVSTIHGNSR